MIGATVADKRMEEALAVPQSRKKYWVAPAIQGRFIGWLVAASTVIATTVSWAILLLVWAPLRNKVVWVGQGFTYEGLFSTLLMRVLLTTGAFILLFGAVSFFVGLLLSHRVAGPLHRLGRVAKDASDGADVGKVAIREHDYIHDFADEFNGMVKSFQERETAQTKALHDIEQELARLEFFATEGMVPPEDLSKKVRESLEITRDILEDAEE